MALLLSRVLDAQFRAPYYAVRYSLKWDNYWICNLLTSTLAPPGPPPGNLVYDLPPLGPIQTPYRSWTWAYNLNLIGQDQLPVGEQVFSLAPRGYEYPAENRTWTQNLISYTLKPLPYGQQVFALPPKDYQQPLRSWTWSYLLTLIGQDQLPIGDQTFALPPLGPIQTPYRSWQWSYNLNLIGQDVLPVGEQSTALPPKDYLQPAKGWTKSFELWIFQQLPSGKQIWDVPQQPIYPTNLRTWIQAINPNLLIQPVPFGTAIWDRPPYGPDQPLRGWTNSYNLNLIGQDIVPGAQFWDRFFGPIQPPRSWTWSYNLNLIGQDALPVGEQVYALPPKDYDRANQLRTWIQSVNIALTAPALPFNQYDWPNPKQPLQPAKGWNWSYNLNLIGKDVLPPGKQFTALPPKGPEQPIKTWQFNYNLNLIGKDSLPVGIQVYNRPVLREPFVDRTFINAPRPPFMAPPSTTLPFNNNMWALSAAWAWQQYSYRNYSFFTPNNLPLDIPNFVSPIPPVPPPTPPEDNRIAYNAGNEWQMLDRIKEPGPVGWR